MSSATKRDEPSKRMGFMSRVSSVLLSTKTKRRSKSKTSSAPSSVLTRRSSPPIVDKNLSISNIATEDQEPGYSTIHDLTRFQRVDNNHEDLPPVPQKIMDIYATVKKKGARLTDHTEDINTHPTKQEHSHSATERKKEASRREELINAQSSQEEDEMPFTDLKYNTKATNKAGKHASHLRKTYAGHSRHQGHTAKHISQPDSSSQVPIQSSSKLFEELLNLRQEMQHTDRENEVLRAKINELLEKEHDWRDDLERSKLHQQEHLYAVESNAELNRRIAKLEMDTQQEVQLLCRQITVMKHEKDELIQQMKAFHRQHDILQKNYEKSQDQQKNMISIERHVKVVEEGKTFIEEIKKKYEQDMAKSQTVASKIEDQRNSLSIKVVLIEGELKRLKTENVQLKKYGEEREEKIKELSRQVEHLKNHHTEATTVISSLMKTAEVAIIERDAALKKSQMQDHQNQLIHTSVIDHSMKVGRLEEHIMNLRKEMDEEVAKALMSKNDKELDYNYMKDSYERQLHFLREKLVQKSSSLDTIVKEKRQLELDLEHMWEATLLSENAEKKDLFMKKFMPGKLNNY